MRAPISYFGGKSRIAPWIVSLMPAHDEYFYLHSARTGHDKSGYRHEFGDEDQHRRLAEVLHASPATVLLSGYDDPIYGELYADWHRVERRTWAQVAPKKGKGSAGKVDEVIWSNRPVFEQRRLTHLEVMAGGVEPPRVTDDPPFIPEDEDGPLMGTLQLPPPDFLRSVQLGRGVTTIDLNTEAL